MTTKPEGKWATKEEIAAVLGLSESGFEKSIRRATWFDADAMLEKRDGRNFYRSPEVIEAWSANRNGGKNGASSSDDEHEAMRARVERLKLERELDRLELESGELVSARDVGEALAPMFSTFGSALKALERRHGKGAVEIVADAIDAAEATLVALFPDVDPPPKRAKPDGTKRGKARKKKKPKKGGARAARRSGSKKASS